ncbi:hypothetical protein VTL71DRAFT_654 [Oculimacula yallundae]|uniref:Uncharacterized protein n=1 Tax=Oculimacula yallundae TaxID=86028 RepID=A0ABR4D1R7_9HELO
MPFSTNWQEKRLHLCVLAALSVTIMLFTGVHLRHIIPTRPNWKHHALDCDSFYASDIVGCGMPEQTEEEELVLRRRVVGRSGLGGGGLLMPVEGQLDLAGSTIQKLP